MDMTPLQLKTLFRQGVNITEYLRKASNSETNDRIAIEIAYDLQAGSYMKAMDDKAYFSFRSEYAAEIARIISSLCTPTSLLEAGVGEATTLSGVVKSLPTAPQVHGFDLSWSRVRYARKWLESSGVEDVFLCTGDLGAIPFADRSVDVVFTSHALEPNGGNERPLLQELLRVAGRYLVLVEPGYEFASEEGKAWMERHGYCRDLWRVAEDLGGEVVEHRLFPLNYNPLNPSTLTIVRVPGEVSPPADVLACPRYKTPLVKTEEAYFSPEAMVAYPILDGIPCLRIENGIIAGSYPFDPFR